MGAGEVLDERETLEGVMSMLAAFQLDQAAGVTRRTICCCSPQQRWRTWRMRG